MISGETLNAFVRAANSDDAYLPPVGQNPTRFGDVMFETGASVPDRPGVFILTHSVNGRWVPLYIGEAESIANAIKELKRDDRRVASACKDALWMASPFAEVRQSIVKRLIDAYMPALNELDEARPCAA